MLLFRATDFFILARRGLPIMGWAMALLLGACHFTTVDGNPVFRREEMRQRPPRTLAILPTTDVSDHAAKAPLLRKGLFKAFAAIPAYQTLDLKLVDEFLAVQATRRGCHPRALPPEALADPRLADCVIFTEIQDFGRVYFFLYAHYRIELNLAMVDTRTRRTIYYNRFVLYDRMIVPDYDVIGLVGSSILSLWHLNPERTEEVLEEGAEEIVAEIPAPELLATSPGGQLKLVRADVLTSPTMGVGRPVLVRAQGTPGCRVSFSLGQLAREVAMNEAQTGYYEGQYKIRPGEQAPYAVVELTMKAPDGRDSLAYVADEKPFTIDTAPPPMARITKGRAGWLRRGVALEFAIDPAEARLSGKNVAKYLIYRREVGAGQYHLIGETTRLSWRDRSVAVGRRYEYCVVSEDAAGNRAAPGAGVRVSVK